MRQTQEPGSGAAAAERLAHERVVADGATPGAWLYVLHGIYGAGRNWGSVARALVERRPDWGAVLVDLRGHGASPPMGPPHTVRAAAADLAELVRETLPEDADHAVLGHSFGGKVALAYAQRASRAPAQTWLIDSTPAPREPGGSAWVMLDALEGLPGPFAARAEAVEGLVGRGFAEGVARWMSSNLRRDDDGLRWGIDAAVMRALLEDFFSLDLWPALEEPASGPVEVVAATESDVLRPVDLGRIAAIADGGDVRLHRVRGGHWLNADNPGAVVDLLAAGLPTP
ncbi:MAG TPA: alpha/beta hydrolase [Longimicrobiales bacterium]|nr:alpha/beta hydrolase [Longimicrobiales bacterium]